MSKRNEFVRNLKDRLDEMNLEIDKLTGKAGAATTVAKNELQAYVESLKAKRDAVHQKLEELQHSGEGTWEDMKSRTELAWSAMSEAFNSAKSRLE